MSFFGPTSAEELFPDALYPHARAITENLHLQNDRTVKEDIESLGKTYLGEYSMQMTPCTGSDTVVTMLRNEFLHISKGNEAPKRSWWKRSFLSPTVTGRLSPSNLRYRYCRRFTFYFCSNDDQDKLTMKPGRVSIPAWLEPTALQYISRGQGYVSSSTTKIHDIKWESLTESLPSARDPTVILVDDGLEAACITQAGLQTPLYGHIALCASIVGEDNPEFFAPFDEHDVPEGHSDDEDSESDSCIDDDFPARGESILTLKDFAKP